MFFKIMKYFIGHSEEVPSPEKDTTMLIEKLYQHTHEKSVNDQEKNLTGILMLINSYLIKFPALEVPPALT
jgi:hypothetical protein